MTEPSRLKRPAPERTAPIRGGWLDLFGGMGALARGGPAETAAPGPRESPPAATEPIARAVELGYKVVDDYLRQGQEVARRFSDRRSTASGIGGDVQDLMTRWFQYTSELTEVWFQLVGLAAVGQMPRAAAAAEPTAPASAPGGGAAAAAVPAAAPGPLRVGVRVLCSRPVEVLLDLRPAAPGTALLVHDLRAADADKPRIGGVSVAPAPDGEALELRIHIPDAQPPGTYSGLVLDAATSLPAGTVAVRIP